MKYIITKIQLLIVSKNFEEKYRDIINTVNGFIIIAGEGRWLQDLWAWLQYMHVSHTCKKQ